MGNHYQRSVFLCLKIVLETTRQLIQQYVFTSLYFPCPILFSTFNVIAHIITSKLLLIIHKTSSKIEEDKVIKLIDDWVVLRYILPIGLYAATSLVASQFIYIYLNMHFIQCSLLCFPVLVIAMEQLLKQSSPSYVQLCCIFAIIFGIRIVLFDVEVFPLIAFLIMLTTLWYESVTYFTTQELSHYLLTFKRYTPMECYFLYYLISYFWLILATCCFEIPLFVPRGIGFMIVEHLPYFALTMSLTVLLTIVDSVLLNSCACSIQSISLLEELGGWFWLYKLYQVGSVMVLYGIGVLLFGEEVSTIQHIGTGITLIGCVSFYLVRLIYNHHSTAHDVVVAPRTRNNVVWDRLNQPITPDEIQDPENEGHIMC